MDSATGSRKTAFETADDSDNTVFDVEGDLLCLQAICGLNGDGVNEVVVVVEAAPVAPVVDITNVKKNVDESEKLPSLYDEKNSGSLSDRNKNLDTVSGVWSSNDDALLKALEDGSLGGGGPDDTNTEFGLKLPTNTRSKTSTLKSESEPTTPGRGSSSGECRPLKRTRSLRRQKNVFIINEADVSGDDSEDDEPDDELQNTQTQDSFVDDEEIAVTASDEARYLTLNRREIEIKVENIEVQTHGTHMDGSTYEHDSFCVTDAGDGSDHVEIGCFTQSMMEAKEMLQQEDSGDLRQDPTPRKMNLRSGKGQAQVTQKPKKARVLVFSESSDEGPPPSAD